MKGLLPNTAVFASSEQREGMPTESSKKAGSNSIKSSCHSSSQPHQQYEELEQIGKGSFGRVKKIRRVSDGRILVCKEMSYADMSSRQKQQLVTEVNVLKQLCHENIVQYYDRIVSHKEHKVFIIMEYCSGGDLSTYIKQLKQKAEYIPEDIIWKFIYQILSALQECHSKKIMHRDLKPANIFMHENADQGDSNLKIGDFGLSRELGEHSEFAQTNVGTPYYMSPEQVRENCYNEKSDIWSAGCIFYEITALRRPFEAGNHLALAQAITKGQFPRIPLRFSDNLQNLIEKMLEVDPGKRWSTQEILNLPYLSIRNQQKKVKSNLKAVNLQEERLLKKNLCLKAELQRLELQLRETENNSYRKKDLTKMIGDPLNETEQECPNKQNLQNYGNYGHFTDRC